MGAWFDMHDFDGTLSTTELRKRFKDHQDDCAYEDGHSYSGRLNMCPGLDVEDKTFENYNEAVEYIQTKAEKWENAVAVRYKISRPIKDKKVDDLSTQVRQLTSQINTLKDELEREAKRKELTKVSKKLESLIKRLQKKAATEENRPTKWLLCGLCSS